MRLLGSRWGAMLALALVATLWLGRQAGTLYESTSKSSLLYGAAGRNDRLVIEWERQRARAPGAPKVLVAQTVANGPYLPLLETSRPANKAYAMAAGYDYMSLVGVAYGRAGQLSTFNKVFILDMLVRQGEYDVVFYLDADALVVNPAFRVEDVAPGWAMLTACQGGTSATWNMNIGVFIWNLRHPRTPSFVAAWRDASVRAIWWNRKDDQNIIHRLLREMPEDERAGMVDLKTGPEYDLFNYSGPNVYHFMRESSRDWTGNSVEGRVQHMQAIIRDKNLPTLD